MFKRTIKIKNNYLFFPIQDNAEKDKVWLSQKGEILYDLDLRLGKNNDYVTWLDVKNEIGGEITISCKTDGLLDLIYQGDLLPEDLYEEKYRPYYHFTPVRGWVNDPNGLVYANGKYHLFYQYNPYDTRWGNMHWGHSVSTDMMNWEYKGISLFPDSMGTMYSGSAIFDKDNVSGLGTKENPPILIYYTAAGCNNDVSMGKPFTICLAYSLDDGETFVKYEKNPIIKNMVYGNRDPKVFYDQTSKKWVMTLFMDHHDFLILNSDNLFDWEKLQLCSFPTMNECPDLFPISGTDKWAFMSGADYWGHKSVAKYVIGDFDGVKFTQTGGPYLVDYGKEFYSTQTFDNDPFNRRVMIGWRTRNFHIPSELGMPFNGEYSVPSELKACTVSGELRLSRYPVKEFFDLCNEVVYVNNAKYVNASSRDCEMFDQAVGESYCVEISFKPKNNALVIMFVSGERIVYNTEMQTLELFEKNIYVPLEDNGVKLLILRDTVSLEIFAQDGKYPVSGYFTPLSNNVKCTVFRGEVEDFSCEIKKVKGCFKGKK